MPMLEVQDLAVRFTTPEGVVRAVDGVSFALEPGETLGVVGESGSGKSAMALSLMQLNPQPPCSYPRGEILLDGRDLMGAREREMRKVRGNEIAMIFQDPMMCLNPVYTIGDQIMEAVRIHQRVPRREAWRRTLDVLHDVGISHPERSAKNYPHQFSGGMRQRAMIAMALSCNPKVLIADEPTTALDVTIQAQILELVLRLQESYGTAVVVITHDLGVIAQVADRVMVMYAGKAVETGTVQDIFYDSLMPYSWALLRAIPRLDTAGEVRLLPIGGGPPSLITLPDGCSFSPRCPFAHSECLTTVPELRERAPGHFAACVLPADDVRSRRSEVDQQLGLEEQTA